MAGWPARVWAALCVLAADGWSQDRITRLVDASPRLRASEWHSLARRLASGALAPDARAVGRQGATEDALDLADVLALDERAAWRW